jgi:CheY-like chemotaxis protein
MLEEAGFEVTEACDGREALARAARNPPALIPTRPAT